MLAFLDIFLLNSSPWRFPGSAHLFHETERQHRNNRFMKGKGIRGGRVRERGWCFQENYCGTFSIAAARCTAQAAGIGPRGRPPLYLVFVGFQAANLTDAVQKYTVSMEAEKSRFQSPGCVMRLLFDPSLSLQSRECLTRRHSRDGVYPGDLETSGEVSSRRF